MRLKDILAQLLVCTILTLMGGSFLTVVKVAFVGGKMIVRGGPIHLKLLTRFRNSCIGVALVLAWWIGVAAFAGDTSEDS